MNVQLSHKHMINYIHQKTREDSIIYIHTRDQDYHIKDFHDIFRSLNSSSEPLMSRYHQTANYLTYLNKVWKDILNSLRVSYNTSSIKLIYTEKKYLSKKLGTLKPSKYLKMRWFDLEIYNQHITYQQYTAQL